MTRLGVGAAVLAAVAGCGCDHAPSKEGALTPSRLALDAPPPARSVLTIGGREIPVSVMASRGGDGLWISLKDTSGVELEREVYRHEAAAFCLVQAGGETFTPALPILKFPFSIGDSWAWEGTLMAGDVVSPANAKIETTRESILTPPSEALRVSVGLVIRNRAASTRELGFWFVEGRGLVQRQFGASFRHVEK